MKSDLGQSVVTLVREYCERELGVLSVTIMNFNADCIHFNLTMERLKLITLVQRTLVGRRTSHIFAHCNVLCVGVCRKPPLCTLTPFSFCCAVVPNPKTMASFSFIFLFHVIRVQ